MYTPSIARNEIPSLAQKYERKTHAWHNDNCQVNKISLFYVNITEFHTFSIFDKILDDCKTKNQKIN